VVCKENPYCLDRPQVVLLHSRKGIKIKPTVVDFANDGLIKLEIIC
jgi:hypothetical protein